MKYLITIATLFVIVSMVGWVIELFFRRFVSQKKWVNPGFLTGPYLPIYGFGVIVLYAISNINFGIENQILDVVIKIAIIGIGMTVIEFIAGLIFIKGMKIKLWDYSNRKGNIMGIICPSFSIIWLLVGSLYFFFVNPFLVNALIWISENLIYTFFVGLVIGMVIVDFAYSIHLLTKLKKFKETQSMRYEEVKTMFKNKVKELRNKKGEL